MKKTRNEIVSICTFEKALLKGFIFVVLIGLNFNSSAQLQEGIWFKIPIKETGVYKLNAAFFKKFKIKIENVNPQNIRLFGAETGMLPQRNDAKPKTNLQEMAIAIEGEADGRFDAADYLIFYAESPDNVNVNKKTKAILHQKNVYSDSSYYFLNFGNTKGKRIQNAKTTATTGEEIKRFQHFEYREKDLKNMVNSGREWVGEYFGVSPKQSFKIATPGLMPNSAIIINSETMVATTSTANFEVLVNGQKLIQHDFDPIGSGRFDTKGRLDFQSKSKVFEAKDSLTLQYVFNPNKDGQGYLNYFSVQSERFFQNFATQTTAFLFDLKASKNYTIVAEGSIDGLKILKVSDVYNAQYQPFNANKSAFEADSTLAKFQCFTDKNAFVPSGIQSVANQKIKAYSTPTLLIVTAPNFVIQAEKLATYRKQHDAMDAIVVSTDEIYNEFAGGRQDPAAIRNYVRYLHNQNPAQLKYLLLFGDADFDFRNTYQSAYYDKNSFVPSYESRESFHPVKSYSSDDFYGFLEAQEGEWLEEASGNHSLEIGVGRLPVKSIEEAEAMIEKIKYYENSKNAFGSWRTQVSFLADDGDSNIHLRDAEQLSDFLAEKNTPLSLNKIYLDAFPQLASSSGAKSPATNAEIKKSGLKSLVMNYNGHGGVSGFAEEKIITIGEIEAWQNKNNLPLLFTATCDFGRFDSPFATSGAELALLNPNGGAIALLSTTRPVYSSTNFTINRAFYETLASIKANERLGDVHRQTKNRGIDDIYNRNFSLLGDPSLKLALPERSIFLTKINGKIIGKDTLKAQQKVAIEGIVKQNGFNGILGVKVFDKAQQKNTLGNESSKISYESYQKILFEGSVSFKNGNFKIDFVMPKDIDYRYGNGRIECYAVNADSTLDAVGVYTEVLIGGSEKKISIDNTLPKIEWSFANENQLIASVFDESGINLTDEIGHEIWLTIDDSLKIKALPYFSTVLNNYQNGRVIYPAANLKAGKHTVQLKIWDTQNNFTESSFEFKTIGSKALNTTASPNPFREKVQIKAQNDWAGADLKASFTVYDAAGRLIYESVQNLPNSEAILYFDWYSGGNLRTEKCYYKVQLQKQSESKSGGGVLIFWK
jgi:hypothetical protein